MVFSNIHNRCWKYAIIDVSPLFISSTDVLDNGIILPNFEKYIRVKYRYVPMIKNMIEKIIRK